MTITSLHGRTIQYEVAEVAAENEAIDALGARVMASNLAHLADGCAQPLVAYPLQASGDGIEFTFAASDFDRLILVAAFGPFFLRCRGDGQSYGIRYRLNARTVGVSKDLTYFVHVAPAGALERTAWWREELSTGRQDAQVHTVGSTTGSWVAPDAGSPILRLNAASMSAARRPFGTREEIGGRRREATVFEAEIGVYVTRASGSTSVTGTELLGFYAAECQV